MPLELVVNNPNGSTQRYAYQVGPGGHVLGLTTADGTIAARYFYDPWGRVLSVAGANPALAERQPLRYRGYYYDTETAMYYLPERYYDPVLARFISQDAIQPDLADPIALNLYAYCLNDPVNLFDPSGEIGLLKQMGAATLGLVLTGLNRGVQGIRTLWNRAKRIGRFIINRGAVPTGGGGGGGGGGGAGGGWTRSPVSCHGGGPGGHGTPMSPQRISWEEQRRAEQARMVENGRAIAAELRLTVDHQMRFSQQTRADWEYNAAGAVADQAIPFLGPPAIIIGVGIDALNIQRVQNQPDATWADIGSAYAGLYPGISTFTLLYHGAATLDAWLRPWDTSTYVQP